MLHRVESRTRGVRRPHRRDARQHGPAAPQHARRAPGGAADRRRSGLEVDAAHRLSAPLRGEDRRERAPRQWIPYTDRMDYLAGMNMNLGWSLAVEKLLGMEVPEKARHLRVLIVRTESHRQPPGGRGNVRAGPGQFHALHVLLPRAGEDPRSVRAVCGGRLTYSYITVGGVTVDLPSGWLQKCERFLRSSSRWSTSCTPC